jgi:hypothetical protein
MSKHLRIEGSIAGLGVTGVRWARNEARNEQETCVWVVYCGNDGMT